MGAESFFIILIADGVKEQKDEFGIRKYIGKSNISKSELIEFLESRFVQVENQRFTFEDILEVVIDSDINDYIKTISIECCFFHFEEGLELMFELFDKIKIRFPFKLFHPGINRLEGDNKITSIQLIKEFYDEKYKTFIRDFGIETNGAKVLPNNGFISYLEHIGRLK